MNNVLIIGGTNKTADNIAFELEKQGYTIECMTYRDEEKIINQNRQWEYLDLFDEKSVEKFLESQKNKKYNKIILTIANSASAPDLSLDFDKLDLKKFYGTFCVNYIFLIKGLLKNIADYGSMIYISSIATQINYRDAIYSSGKALIQCYILSLKDFLKEGQSICSISPGTILNSTAYNRLPEGHHNRLNSHLLASPKGISELIINSGLYNGQNIKIGN